MASLAHLKRGVVHCLKCDTEVTVARVDSSVSFHYKNILVHIGGNAMARGVGYERERHGAPAAKGVLGCINIDVDCDCGYNYGDSGSDLAVFCSHKDKCDLANLLDLVVVNKVNGKDVKINIARTLGLKTQNYKFKMPSMSQLETMKPTLRGGRSTDLRWTMRFG